MQKDSTCLLYASFADLLEYPTADLRQQVEACRARLRGMHPGAETALEGFSLCVGRRTLEQMQELFTGTFDMQPVCAPYVGCHLFGESYKRGAFMAQLNAAYHAFGYSAGQELPDHLSVILRFLSLDSINRQGEFCQVLLQEGVAPALEKMLGAFGGQPDHPYAGLLAALRLVLVPIPEKELHHA